MPFTEALMTGQAPDGGLLVPRAIPDVTDRLAAWRGLGYCPLAYEILRLYADDIPGPTLRALVERSYASFDTPEVAPLRRLGEIELLELFHGPTLAFKDVALQLLGNLFEHVLGRRGGRLNILGATSGDTGSAGIHGVRGKTGIRIFVMYPEGRTSPLQERQMTTVVDDNVHCLAIDGSFDDCQRVMKSIFNDLEFKARHHLGAINSINCARLLAQIVYYFYAYLRTVGQVGEPVSFAVPTGNFGDIFAGYLARKMGLPIERLVLATNENEILRVFFETGLYRRGAVQETLSPSMDIQVASNFERYLYYRLGEDSGALTRFMQRFAETGEAALEDYLEAGIGNAPISGVFTSRSIHRAETLEVIGRYYREHGYLLDPHTAVGVAAGERWLAEQPEPRRLVCLATAHPAKFPAAIEAAVGEAASHPALAALEGRPTRSHRLRADAAQVRAYLERHCG